MKYVQALLLGWLIATCSIVPVPVLSINNFGGGSSSSGSSSASASSSSSSAGASAVAFAHRSFLKGYYRTISTNSNCKSKVIGKGKSGEEGCTAAAPAAEGGNHQSEPEAFRIRQVPGDGGCLFHALAAWLTYLQSGSSNTHVDFDWRMRNLSQKLRRLAVDILRKNETLVLEDGEKIDTSSLLAMVAEHYDMSVAEYCEQMNDPRTWGGGPEIVALSNHFQCPIHVYQLTTTTKAFFQKSFALEICARFGSPDFDSKMPIYLLCADGRFPNIRPGEQKETGDHFLALFPATMLRGGGFNRLSRFSPPALFSNRRSRDSNSRDSKSKHGSSGDSINKADDNNNGDGEVSSAAAASSEAAIGRRNRQQSQSRSYWQARRGSEEVAESDTHNVQQQCDMSLCPHLRQEAEAALSRENGRPPFPWFHRPHIILQQEQQWQQHHNVLNAILEADKAAAAKESAPATRNQHQHGGLAQRAGGVGWIMPTAVRKWFGW